MRWSCPHCGIHLAASDDKVGNGWSFSRCYKCGGFALIRQAQVNVIKVDKAPAGEHVILPESDETPLLGKAAAATAQKIMEKAAPQAAQSATGPMAQIAAQIASSKTGAASAPQVITSQVTQKVAPAANASSSSVPFPDALPSVPEVTFVQRMIPYATGLAGLVAIASGGYLYLHGQSLWNRTKITLQDQNPPNEVVDQVSSQASAPARTPAETSLSVRVKSGTSQVYQGPGVEYAPVATAHSEQTLQVIDWNENWFKVTVPSGAAKKVGWIKSDQVQRLNGAPSGS